MNRGNRRGEFSPMREGNDFQPGNRAPRNFNNRPDFGDKEGAEEKLIILDPDIAEVFRSSDHVNQALRSLLSLARQVTRGARPGGGQRPGGRPGGGPPGGGLGGGPGAGPGGGARRRRQRGGNNPTRPPKPTRPEGLPVDDEFEEE